MNVDEILNKSVKVKNIGKPKNYKNYKPRQSITNLQIFSL